MPRFLQARPAIAVTSLARSVPFYVDRLGFSVAHQDDDLCVLTRDAVELHLWVAGDEGWKTRGPGDDGPVVSGAESFIAGTHSVRIVVDDVDALYPPLVDAGVVHPRAPLRDQPWGDREFGVLDPDGNLITLLQPDPSAPESGSRALPPRVNEPPES